MGLDCGDIAGKPPHDVGTGLTGGRPIALSGSIGAAFGCGTVTGAALVAVVEVTGAAASWKFAEAILRVQGKTIHRGRRKSLQKIRSRPTLLHGSWLSFKSGRMRLHGKR